jgi:hypothetical protein
MCTLSSAKTRLLIALVDITDQCKKEGQNGLISTAIAETIKQVMSKEQINLIIEHLK